MPAFYIQRIALTAGVNTRVVAPNAASHVDVGNVGPGDLLVKTSITDASQYVRIMAGFERPFNLPRTGFTDGIDGQGRVSG
jgi:D-arabinose 5-phosphate isomerase GutQ